MHSRRIRPGGPVDADCLPALMRLTTRVLILAERVAAGDEQAAREALELAALAATRPVAVR